MTRINLILFAVLIVVSLGVITAQHKARKLYIELEHQETLSSGYQTELGQLQLEQSTWAMHSRLEEYAQQKLRMQVPDVKRIQVIQLEGVR
ncbi:MAG: cell division protein FtsL [Methylophilaceae bacterium 17-44-8]|jgi:cell division protein FtsL|nr:MAG: cell division protein FtsL [Methylophilales bacterium 28-44-11]OYY98842.1 MAG: cell division protein FtsL [Methylophilales bacterium 16-45-7]OZA05491.1 MAG: cell division protein FtsL [Methylophilaceae bacterium 17-44-8]